ncbi:hypothetical protein CLV47_12052 [Antricoccus suffuscus]|uniref:SnoaL-like protein n=1 Tax=Antricoccus suffuscus TaxID=1629062 RepID=A0A2T0ZQJ0_9ACTN|nr:Rv3235 family protein [Antricoccus suffuscus]PRZ38585.1 hypothetical protein CLV47_12052 [Antricoccus suffuscus]
MSVVAVAVYRAPSSEPEPLAVSAGPAQTTERRHLTLVQPAEQLLLDGFEPQPGRHPTTRAGRDNDQAVAGPPEVLAFARQYCRMAAEVLTGFRPVEQLRPHTALGIMEWFRQYAIPIARHRQIAPAPAIRTLGVCTPVAGVAEVNAVIQRGPRARAMTARFVEYDDEWKCVHLQVI